MSAAWGMPPCTTCPPSSKGPHAPPPVTVTLPWVGAAVGTGAAVGHGPLHGVGVGRGRRVAALVAVGVMAAVTWGATTSTVPRPTLLDDTKFAAMEYWPGSLAV